MDEPVAEREGSGLFPYFAPMIAFLLLVNAGSHLGSEYTFPTLILQVVVPLSLLIIFRLRGAYPELTFRISSWTVADIVVGIALAAMWIAPFLIIPSMRPDPEGISFDPNMLGASYVWLVLGVRMLGYAIVTPLMEELFMRSFLMRYVEAFDGDGDFRDAPIAKFGIRSFSAVVFVFLMTHTMWEWWVMLPWAVLTNLWFYYRKDMFAVVVAHAATNGAILIAAIVTSEKLRDIENSPVSLWFLV